MIGGIKLNPTHITTLVISKPFGPNSATTGSKNPFPRRVARILNSTGGSPIPTKPSKKPLLLGMILQGPLFRNLPIPNV